MAHTPPGPVRRAFRNFRRVLRRAACMLGMERGSASEGLIARCNRIVRIPARLSLNLAAVGAVVMYDQSISVRRFADCPVARVGS